MVIEFLVYFRDVHFFFSFLFLSFILYTHTYTHTHTHTQGVPLYIIFIYAEQCRYCIYIYIYIYIIMLHTIFTNDIVVYTHRERENNYLNNIIIYYIIPYLPSITYIYHS